MLRAPVVLSTSILLAVALCGCGAAPQRPACATSATCGSDRLCVTGVCRPKNEIPTEAAARRLELVPDRWAVVTSKGSQPWHEADLPLGRADLGQVCLLMHFDSPLRESSRVVSAFLVLDPSSGATPGPAPVPLSVSRILEPWNATPSWNRLPALAEPEANALASNWAARPLRIDVTREVVRWKERREDDHGIALVAAPHDPVGASFSLGLAGGRGPRLEIYLR
ncbi:MAG TPA: hypothetical protein PLI95_00370 [Polyangiaceae bacterium]|nr:hypothetical protein [Polyangiaceae bacterium]